MTAHPLHQEDYSGGLLGEFAPFLSVTGPLPSDTGLFGFNC